MELKSNNLSLKQQRRTRLKTEDVAMFGAEEAMSRPKLALICSRKCVPSLILKTYDFALCVRSSDVAVISGFHSPIEKDCLPILLRGSAPIIIVQAHRLSTSRLSLEWQKAIEAGRLLLLSPFGEREKRVTAQLAAERNRFVASFSDEVLIPYAHPRSKTEALFQELIASGKRVYTFESAVNATLVSAGAIAVTPEFFASTLRSPEQVG